jgi:hypothetical protein
MATRNIAAPLAQERGYHRVAITRKKGLCSFEKFMGYPSF